jgi:hypothetical protein
VDIRIKVDGGALGFFHQDIVSLWRRDVKTSPSLFFLILLTLTITWPRRAWAAAAQGHQ